MRLYLDTSAYLCILLGERGAGALARETTGAELLSSSLLVLETGRNLIRLLRDGHLTEGECRRCRERLDEDIESFLLRDFTLDLARPLTIPPISLPRSLDLAHLLTALSFHNEGPIDRFITMDSAQGQAAEEFGLPV